MRKRVGDLNDLYFFSKIVEHGSFSGAAAELGVANSILSEHMARLEKRLGARLINRTTRKLQITELGSRIYDHCRALAEEAMRVHTLAEEASSKLTLRVICPALLAQHIVSPILGEYLSTHAHTEVVFDISNKSVDVVTENYDIVFRASQQTQDSSLVIRTLAEIQPVLCARTDQVRLKGTPRTPRDLIGYDSVAYPDDRGRFLWLFKDEEGNDCAIRPKPRISSRSASIALDAVLSGAAIGMLPTFLLRSAPRANTLIELLPQWRPARWLFQAAYPSRQGLRPAARDFLQYLTDRLPQVVGANLEGIHPIRPIAPRPERTQVA